MKIVDLQRILYPMSVSLQTTKNDFFYFGYALDLAISILKISENKWELTEYERGISQNIKTFSSEYLTCLNFLYEIDKISTNKPNVMKILDEDPSWILFEKNQIFYFRIFSSRPYIYEDFSIILSPQELMQYRLQGRNFLSNLQYNIDMSNPLKESSQFNNRKIISEINKELTYTSIYEYDLKNNYEDEPLKNDITVIEKSKESSITPQIFLFGVGILIYVVQKIFP